MNRWKNIFKSFWKSLKLPAICNVFHRRPNKLWEIHLFLLSLPRWLEGILNQWRFSQFIEVKLFPCEALHGRDAAIRERPINSEKVVIVDDWCWCECHKYFRLALDWWRCWREGIWKFETHAFRLKPIHNILCLVAGANECEGSWLEYFIGIPC